MLSPDGKWIAFSSDRNTEWKGHGNGSGWEHVGWHRFETRHRLERMLWISKVVVGFQTDRVLRNARRDHVGCSGLRSLRTSHLSDCLYQPGKWQTHGADFRPRP